MLDEEYFFRTLALPGHVKVALNQGVYIEQDQVKEKILDLSRFKACPILTQEWVVSSSWKQLVLQNLFLKYVQIIKLWVNTFGGQTIMT